VQEGWLNYAQTIPDMREEPIKPEAVSQDHEDKPPVSDDEQRRQWEAVRSVS
jgi:hypothetical protein